MHGQLQYSGALGTLRMEILLFAVLFSHDILTDYLPLTPSADYGFSCLQFYHLLVSPGMTKDEIFLLYFGINLFSSLIGIIYGSYPQ